MFGCLNSQLSGAMALDLVSPPLSLFRLDLNYRAASSADRKVSVSVDC